MACNVDHSCSTGIRSARAEAECLRSIEEYCLPSQFLKPYLMYSASDATLIVIDFAKGNLEDGIEIALQVGMLLDCMCIRHHHCGDMD